MRTTKQVPTIATTVFICYLSSLAIVDKNGETGGISSSNGGADVDDYGGDGDDGSGLVHRTRNRKDGDFKRQRTLV